MDIRPLLLLGCQRSGTSLLASMVGRHKDVNMLCESVGKDVFKLIGKQYQGNKLLVPRQINLYKRANRVGYLINRIVNFHFWKYKYHKKRIFVTSKLSIKDYIERGAKIIVITRARKSMVRSMVTRSNMSIKLAEQEYNVGMKIIETLIRNGAFHVKFEQLVKNPERTLKDICVFLGLEFDPRMLEGYKYNFIYPYSKIDEEKVNKLFLFV